MNLIRYNTVYHESNYYEFFSILKILILLVLFYLKEKTN